MKKVRLGNLSVWESAHSHGEAKMTCWRKRNTTNCNTEEIQTQILILKLISKQNQSSQTEKWLVFFQKEKSFRPFVLFNWRRCLRVVCALPSHGKDDDDELGWELSNGRIPLSGRDQERKREKRRSICVVDEWREEVTKWRQWERNCTQ